MYEDVRPLLGAAEAGSSAGSNKREEEGAFGTIHNWSPRFAGDVARPARAALRATLHTTAKTTQQPTQSVTNSEEDEG